MAISIKPPNPLELEFTDGTIKKALFNNWSFIIFTDLYGPLDRALSNELKISPYSFISKVLHCGMKVLDDSVTLEEASNITMAAGQSLMYEVTRLMIENFSRDYDQEDTEVNQESKSKDMPSMDSTFWEALYFSYVIKLMRPEEEFFNSTTVKVIRMLDINSNGLNGSNKSKVSPVKEVRSMRDFLK